MGFENPPEPSVTSNVALDTILGPIHPPHVFVGVSLPLHFT